MKFIGIAILLLFLLGIIAKYWESIVAILAIVGILFLAFSILRIKHNQKEKQKQMKEEAEQKALQEARRAEFLQQRKAKEEEQKALQEARRAEFLQQRKAKEEEFSNTINSLKRAEVEIDSSVTKTERCSVSEMPEYDYTNVTARSRIDKLSNFVVIDTETNGIKLQGGRILELSAIRYENFEPVEAWTTLVNPQTHIAAEASAINHITDDMVKDAPILGSIAKSFVEFVGDAPIVGYNLEFDLRFLFSRGIDLIQEKRKFYDCLTLSRKAFKEDLSSFKLTDVAEYCGIPTSAAHRSLADCYMTGIVFHECIKQITGTSSM